MRWQNLHRRGCAPLTQGLPPPSLKSPATTCMLSVLRQTCRDVHMRCCRQAQTTPTTHNLVAHTSPYTRGLATCKHCHAYKHILCEACCISQPHTWYTMRHDCRLVAAQPQEATQQTKHLSARHSHCPGRSPNRSGNVPTAAQPQAMEDEERCVSAPKLTRLSSLNAQGGSPAAPKQAMRPQLSRPWTQHHSKLSPIRRLKKLATQAGKQTPCAAHRKVHPYA